jgi:hypothetical protein
MLLGFQAASLFKSPGFVKTQGFFTCGVGANDVLNFKLRSYFILSKKTGLRPHIY